MEKDDKKSEKLIKLNPVNKKARKHPYINFEPSDTCDDPKKRKLGEATVTAVSAKTGRKITRHVAGHDAAYKKLHKWLKKRGYTNVKLSEHLAAKSAEFDIPSDLLSEIYERGEADYHIQNPSHLTVDQWAMARVNSFIQGGRALDEDACLLEGKKDYRITNKTPNKALGKLAKREDDIGHAARKEIKARKGQTFPSKDAASKHLEKVLTGKSKLKTPQARRLMKTLGIHHKSAQGKALLSAAAKHESGAVQNNAVKKADKATLKAEKDWAYNYAGDYAARHAERQKAQPAPVSISKSSDVKPKKKGLISSVLSKLRLREALQNDLEQQNGTDAQPQQDNNRDGANSNQAFQKAIQRRNKKHARPPKFNVIKPAQVAEGISSYTKPSTAKPKMKTLTTDMDKAKAKFKMQRHTTKLHKKINKMRETCAAKLIKFYKGKKS